MAEALDLDKKVDAIETCEEETPAVRCLLLCVYQSCQLSNIKRKTYVVGDTLNSHISLCWEQIITDNAEAQAERRITVKDNT